MCLNLGYIRKLPFVGSPPMEGTTCVRGYASRSQAIMLIDVIESRELDLVVKSICRDLLGLDYTITFDRAVEPYGQMQERLPWVNTSEPGTIGEMDRRLLCICVERSNAVKDIKDSGIGIADDRVLACEECVCAGGAFCHHSALSVTDSRRNWHNHRTLLVVPRQQTSPELGVHLLAVSVANAVM